MYSIIAFQLVCIYRNLSISLNEVFKSMCLIFKLMCTCNQHFFWSRYIEHLVNRENIYFNQMVLHKYIKLLKLKQ